MEHPDLEKLTGYIYELDEQSGAVEEHLRGCSACAMTALRLQRERALFERALAVPVPVPRRRPMIWAAAAVLAVASLAAAVHFAYRAHTLERALALHVVPEEGTLEELCRNEIDRSVLEMVAHAGLSTETRVEVREALLLASSTPMEVFDRYLRGEVDETSLATMDLFAPLDGTLRSRLQPEAYEKVCGYLEKSRTAAAGALARRAGDELEREVGLSAEQRRHVERVVEQRVAGRVDIAFLPEPMWNLVRLSTIRAGEADIKGVLDDPQRERFNGFLERQREQLRRRYS